MAIEKSALLKEIPLSEIQFKYPIGEGSYGAVYLADWQGVPVAVKKLFLKTTLNDLARDFHRETTLMGMCQSPQVIKAYGACLESGYWIVMEYMPKGSLCQVLRDREECLDWYPTRWQIASDIAKGLAYLHDYLNIVHCDVRSPNILLDHEYHAKITDFGLASFANKITKKIGISAWTAPEVAFGALPSKASDVYAYGTVLWEIASRRFPFRNIYDVKNGVQEEIPEDCPAHYASLIILCWKECLSRPTMAQINDDIDEIQPKNHEDNESIKDIQLAAQKGDPIAQFNLGWCYQYGLGVNKNLVQAAKYYQLSADQGDATSQYHIGLCYLDGSGVKRNVHEAVKYFQLAANQKHADSQYELALCHENGLGVKKDLVHAVAYYRLAAAQGCSKAKSNLERLYSDHPELAYQGVLTFQPSFTFFPAVSQNGSSAKEQPMEYESYSL